MSALRLLVVDPAGELYGSEKVLLDLLRHLDRAAFDVTIACPPDGPLWDVLAARGERRIPIAPPGSGKVRSVLALRRAIARARPEVIHLNQAGTHKHVMLALAGRRVPVLVHVRLAEDAAHVQTRVARWLAPAGFIAISHYIRGLLAPDAPAVTIYDAFDAEAWQASVRPAGLRARLGLAPETRVVLFVGRVCQGKGVDVLVSVAERVPANVHVVVAGGPPAGRDHAEYYLAVSQAGSRAISFLGPQTDVAPLVAESDVLVVPSRAEALGRVLFEALALGVPVVASAVGGMREVVGADERGWAVAPGDAAAVVVALSDVFARPGEAARRTAAGATWVEAHCNPAAHARSVENVYQMAVHRPL